MKPFTRIEGAEVVSYEKIILALWQKCKDEGLTVDRALFVLDEVKRKIELDARNAVI